MDLLSCSFMVHSSKGFNKRMEGKRRRGVWKERKILESRLPVKTTLDASTKSFRGNGGGKGGTGRGKGQVNLL